MSAGAHIKGEVPLLLDYFATEETWKQNSDGSGTPKKTSAYYYILPANNDVWFGVRMRTEDYKGAEKLVDETYNYFMGNGDMPTATIAYEGRTVKMKDEYPQLIDSFREELSIYGFLEEEIEAKEKELSDLKHELLSSQTKLENTDKNMKALQSDVEEYSKKVVRLETELKDKK